MRCKDVYDLATGLMEQYGLSEKGWRFSFTKAKTACGVCKYRTKTIGISTYYVTHNDEAAIRNTILHEIAHALAGPGAGHGPLWKAHARSIGAKPERCNSTAVMPKGKYRATCPCGAEYHRHRLTQRTRYGSLCGRCRTKLEWFTVNEVWLGDRRISA